MKNLKVFILLLLLISSLPIIAKTYYVATDGKDDNSGSIGLPFATIQRAQDAVEAGDTVFIRGGKYKMTENQWKQLLAIPNSILETNGTLWWPSREAKEREGKEGRNRPNLLKLVNCHRVLLEGVTFQNSPGWNLNPILCEDVTLRNVVVRNPWYAQNGDGLDISACQGVIVYNSVVDAGDDAICIKPGGYDAGRGWTAACENIIIADCTVYHGHGGFVIGSESYLADTVRLVNYRPFQYRDYIGVR